MGTYQNNYSLDPIRDGLSLLGLESQIEMFFYVSEKDNYVKEPELWFQLEKAEMYKADAVFFRRISSSEYIPQIYIYDYTQNPLLANNTILTKIHKNVWTGGEVPIVCIFTDVEIKILDTTQKIVEDKKNRTFSPRYLIDNLLLVSRTHQIFNENFAQSISLGSYWEFAPVNFRNSSYDTLIELLRKVVNKVIEDTNLEKPIVQRLIIQSILVKYLEERIDNEGNRVFPESFFKKYGGAREFSDVFSNGHLFPFFDELNKNRFNGGVFEWKDEEKAKLVNANLSYLAAVLRGYTDKTGQGRIEFEDDNFSRLYAFNYIPVELISRLYEEFVIKDENTAGVAYTPAHLVKLLVNEAMPLKESLINVDEFKILDPACGSAIFLVVAFKRLVQWWRKNNCYDKPSLDRLKKLLRSVYGVDIDQKAAQIAKFSLSVALCDELTPKQIWNELKFENLEGKTIFHKDFFLWKDEEGGKVKFDLIIGNPPFIRGGVKKELKFWSVNKDTKIEIPQNQIALKFLVDSFSLLKEGGRTCLIVKSLPILYSSSDKTTIFLKSLFENFHVDQIFDFTPLARNKSLWDGGVDVDTAAIFVSNKKPDFNKNILHAIFRRTKVNKERLYFEIDKYDLNFISRVEAYENPYIFKINLLGGGRLKPLVNRCLSCESIKQYLEENNCDANEGFMYGDPDKAGKSKDFMYNYQTLPTHAFLENSIKFDELDYIDKSKKFISIPNQLTFEYPNIIIKENIGKKEIPIFLNRLLNFTFKDKLIGIFSLNKDILPLEYLYRSFKANKDLYRLFIYATSGQILVGKNTAILKEDIMRLPVPDDSFSLTKIDENIIDNVNIHMQEFLRHGEKAKILKPLNDLILEIKLYGEEFTYILNNLYSDGNKFFKLTDIIEFGNKEFVGAIFSYDSEEKDEPVILFESEISEIEVLTNCNINDTLSTIRIIQYYTLNKVLFIKPNQKRYWLPAIAYRDADSVFADILNSKI